MFHVRLKVVAAFIFLMMLAVLVRLAYMQVFNSEFYRQEARRRQIRTSYPDAPRGLIQARDGTILADDRTVLNVCVTLKDLLKMPPEELRRWFAAVAAVTGDTTEAVGARIQYVWNTIESGVASSAQATLALGPPGDPRLAKQARREAGLIRTMEYRRPQVIYEDVGFVEAARAEVASSDIGGLVVTESMQRKYMPVTVTDSSGRQITARMAHVLGYVSEITRDEWQRYRFDYGGEERKRVFYHDVMGRDGVEEYYNLDLRGARGKREEVINVRGDPQKTLTDDAAQPGATIILAIDPFLQAAAEDALAKILADEKEPRPGAAVCMDVRTGEVLVLASSPSYDPNTIRQDMPRLTDPNGLGRFKPFLNRATDGRYPMGSTFKVVTATAALESGAIRPSTAFTCSGTFQLGKSDFRCWISRPPYNGAHGSLALIKAIQVSCNIYFYNAGLKTGGPALAEWSLGYGFGSTTGIDLASESSGKVPYPRYPGDVVNLSIGQGALLATPVQVCRMIAAVANGGTLLSPRLRREAPPGKTALVGFSSSTLATLRQGLYDVVNVRGGTGWLNVRSDKIVIAGKSGTAQAPDQGGMSGDHAWFAGFAPFDKPEIAFAVLVEHGGHGGAVAGPVAKAIAEAYADEKARKDSLSPGKELALR